MFIKVVKTPTTPLSMYLSSNATGVLKKLNFCLKTCVSRPPSIEGDFWQRLGVTRYQTHWNSFLSTTVSAFSGLLPPNKINNEEASKRKERKEDRQTERSHGSQVAQEEQERNLWLLGKCMHTHTCTRTQIYDESVC